MYNPWEGNNWILSYIQDSFFLSEKRGSAGGRLTWCCSQGGQIAWEQTPLEEGTTWLCKKDQFGSNSGSPKNPASWWWVFLHIKAMSSWVSCKPLQKLFIKKKNAKPLPNLLSSRTKFSGGGQEEVIFLVTRAHVLEKLSDAVFS